MRRDIDLAKLPFEGLTLETLGRGHYTVELDAVPPRDPQNASANDASGMQGRPRGRFILYGEPGNLGGVDWSGMQWLVMDVRGMQKADPGMAFEFWNGGNELKHSDLTGIVGLLPGIWVRVAFPIAAADGSRLFWLPRPKGRLKMVVHGNRIYMESCRQMAFGFYRINIPQEIEIANVHLTDTEPEYIEEKATLLDELGQWNLWDWPGKTKSESELVARLHTRASLPDRQFPEHLSRYGGLRARQFEATGFFRVVNADGRWWMVDPEGCAFFSAGLDCVGLTAVQTELASTAQWHKALPAKDGPFAGAFILRQGNFHMEPGKPTSMDFFCYDAANLMRAFGDGWREKGYKLVRDYMIEWGFNTLGNWSSPDAVKAIGLPWVLPLREFPDRMIEKKIFRDFPDVFSRQFEEESERYAGQLAEHREDRLLIGYFMRNEPEWAFVEDICIAEELLENPEWNDSKREFISWIAARYGSIGSLNAAWGTSLQAFGELERPIRRARRLSAAAAADLDAFSQVMIDRYVRLPAEALRRVDPNHMNLGMRYAYVDNPTLLSGCDCFDVFSVNCYQMNPGDEMDRLGKLTGLPTVIGEYHFGAMDKGLPATGLKAVADQAARGQAYRCYLESAAHSTYCLGAHYFTLSDQSALGRFDGENYQIGVFDVCFRPYDGFVAGIQSAHSRMYGVMAGELPPFADRPAEHEIVAF